MLKRARGEKEKVYILIIWEEVLSTWSVTVSAIMSGKENQLGQLWVWPSLSSKKASFPGTGSLSCFWIGGGVDACSQSEWKWVGKKPIGSRQQHRFQCGISWPYWAQQTDAELSEHCSLWFPTAFIWISIRNPLSLGSRHRWAWWFGEELDLRVRVSWQAGLAGSEDDKDLKTGEAIWRRSILNLFSAPPSASPRITVVCGPNRYKTENQKWALNTIGDTSGTARKF